MDKDVSAEERPITGKIMYVFRTDKGYLKGDLYKGVTFEEKKEDARKFDVVDAMLYRDSIVSDLTEFFGCTSVVLETVEVIL